MLCGLTPCYELTDLQGHTSVGSIWWRGTGGGVPETKGKGKGHSATFCSELRCTMRCAIASNGHVESVDLARPLQSCRFATNAAQPFRSSSLECGFQWSNPSDPWPIGSINLNRKRGMAEQRRSGTRNSEEGARQRNVIQDSCQVAWSAPLG